VLLNRTDVEFKYGPAVALAKTPLVAFRNGADVEAFTKGVLVVFRNCTEVVLSSPVKAVAFRNGAVVVLTAIN
jgi:hypothetical protein